MNILKRIMGKSYGAGSVFLRNPEHYGGKWNSHIESQWTTPEHFAHNNYQRGHLPQLCIKASGWKARLLALFFWPEPPYEPQPTIVWWKNGDHPDDDVWRAYEDTGEKPTEPREGKIVRYFRHPYTSGDELCSNCHNKMHDHGWIDTEIGGHKVCPGDWIDKNLTGR